MKQSAITSFLISNKNKKSCEIDFRESPDAVDTNRDLFDPSSDDHVLESSFDEITSPNSISPNLPIRRLYNHNEYNDSQLRGSQINFHTGTLTHQRSTKLDLAQLRAVIEENNIKFDVSDIPHFDTYNSLPENFQSIEYEFIVEVDTSFFASGAIPEKTVHVYAHKLLQQETDKVLCDSGKLDFQSFGKALITLKCLNESNIENVAIDKIFMVRKDLWDIVQIICPQNFFNKLLKFSIMVNCCYFNNCLYFNRCVFGYHFYEGRDYMWIRVLKIEVCLAVFIATLNFDYAPRNPQNNEKNRVSMERPSKCMVSFTFNDIEYKQKFSISLDGKIRVFTANFLKKVRITVDGSKIYVFEDDPRYINYLEKRKRQRRSFGEWVKCLKDYMVENRLVSLPRTISEDASLDRFCKNMRYCMHKKKQKQDTERKFTDDMVDELNKLGFKW
jgi:hypothetical protein